MCRQVPDALVTGPRPNNLKDLINRAIDLGVAPGVFSRLRLPCALSPVSHSAVSFCCECALQLSVAEHQRRLAVGACLYCGQEGHYTAGCLAWPQD